MSKIKWAYPGFFYIVFSVLFWFFLVLSSVFSFMGEITTANNALLVGIICYFFKNEEKDNE